MKRELTIGYDYTKLAAFRSIDKYNTGKIDTFNLGTFLRAYSHAASEVELLAIIRRIDTNGDAVIDINEFTEFMQTQANPFPRTQTSNPTPVQETMLNYTHQDPNQLRFSHA